MVKDLLVRGLDDETHSELGNIASKMGVSLNSILKDAVDKWIQNSSQVTKKHDLILYADDESLKNLLRSMNRIAQNDTIFKACCGPKEHHGMQFLTKQGWFNGTVEPYKQFLENPNLYGKKVLEKIGGKVYITDLENGAYKFLHSDNTVVCQVKRSRVSIDEEEEGEEGEEGEAAEGADAPAAEATKE